MKGEKKKCGLLSCRCIAYWKTLNSLVSALTTTITALLLTAIAATVATAVAGAVLLLLWLTRLKAARILLTTETTTNNVAQHSLGLIDVKLRASQSATTFGRAIAVAINSNLATRITLKSLDLFASTANDYLKKEKKRGNRLDIMVMRDKLILK